jgi:2-dehydropantoate 2-reductase
MTIQHPPLAVVGPGAVGGLVAWLLHRSGADVVAVGRPATVEAIRSHGLEVRSLQFGDHIERVRVSTEIPRGASVIVATKSYGLEDVLAQLAAAEPIEVLSLLNGIEHMTPLREALPGIPVVGAAIAVEALRVAPAVIEHRSPFVRVSAPASASGFASVAALDSANPSVRVGGTEAEVLWAKFRFLSVFALVTSFQAKPIGEAIAADPVLAEEVIGEVAALATAENALVTAEALSAALHSVPPGMRSSLQADMAAGSRNELDAIGGALIRVGRAHGIPTPAVQRIVTALGDDLGSEA